MNNSLLPPSASTFMRNVEKPIVRISGIPVDLRKLWDPDECPVEFLPYLAWALSVDRWDKRWSEQTKRQVIKASWLVHRHKGTISALRRVVERLIDDAKPRSRHLTGLSLSLQTQGYIETGAGCYVGDTLTVYPYFPETIAVGGNDYTGAAIHLIDTVEIASGD